MLDLLTAVVLAKSRDYRGGACMAAYSELLQGDYELGRGAASFYDALAGLALGGLTNPLYADLSVTARFGIAAAHPSDRLRRCAASAGARLAQRTPSRAWDPTPPWNWASHLACAWWPYSCLTSGCRGQEAYASLCDTPVVSLG